MILGYSCLVCGYICDAVAILLFAYLMIKPKGSEASQRVDVVPDFESRSSNVIQNPEARTAEINSLVTEPLIDIDSLVTKRLIDTDRIMDILFETDEDLLFKRYKENQE